MKNQKSQIIIQFEPDSDFRRQFLEFLEEVLKFEENKNKEQTKKVVNKPPPKSVSSFENKSSHSMNNK